jgi:hypothetical protein
VKRNPDQERNAFSTPIVNLYMRSRTTQGQPPRFSLIYVSTGVLVLTELSCRLCSKKKKADESNSRLYRSVGACTSISFYPSTSLPLERSSHLAGDRPRGQYDASSARMFHDIIDENNIYEFWVREKSKDRWWRKEKEMKNETKNPRNSSQCLPSSDSVKVQSPSGHPSPSP